jgi:stage V sporulation protein SpoVS
MADNIASVYAVQYGTNISLLLQQKGSKLRGAVQTGSYKGKQSEVVTQYGATSARAVSTRYQPIVPVNTPNNRRWVFPEDYDWADLIDNFDKLRLLADPQSAYSQNGLYAMGRAIDDVIISGIFGANKTGEAGGTTTNFDTANQQVAVNYAAAGNVGLTVDKLREARRVLMENEVDLDAEPAYCAISAEQHDDLLGQLQVTNADFNTDAPVLQDGKVTRFLGINFIHTERLPTSSGFRRCPVWVPSGVHLGMWNDIASNVTQRRDLSSHPFQVYLMGTFGATRTEEKKVVDILCAE